MTLHKISFILLNALVKLVFMKKIFVVLGVLVILSLVLSFLPKQVFKPDNPDIQTEIVFKAYCPAFLLVIDDTTLINQTLAYYNPIDYPSSFRACMLKELIERHHGSEEMIDLRTVKDYVLADHEKTNQKKESFISTLAFWQADEFFREKSPYHAAYFFEYSFNVNILNGASQLAVLYANGIGLPQHSEKAQELFKFEAISLLPPDKIEGECLRHIQEKNNSLVKSAELNSHVIFYQYIRHPYYQKQVKWVESLCFKSDEELQAISETYNYPGEMKGLINSYINSHLRSARGLNITYSP